MLVLWALLFILALSATGFFLGRQRALSLVNGDQRNLHSMPKYYGSNVALKALVPAALLLVVWSITQPLYINYSISSSIPESAVSETSSLGLLMAEVRRVADGLDSTVAQGTISDELARDPNADLNSITEGFKSAGQILTSEITRPMLHAAQSYRSMRRDGRFYMIIAAVALSLLGLIWGIRETQPRFRARNVVENGLKVLLISAASIAILTTIGIVLSLIFNTYEFFTLYPASDFFFGTSWAPSFSGRGGSSDLGILPLLWGTLYISLVALVVAVPIGLFAAIYLSEYAGPQLRAMAKPMLEVLAGIPTIVYGLFALLTVGPLLLAVFGDEGVGIMQAGTAVMTAGLVMGIMLIPFVSSLSDDIINAVPQSMRDGSYALGATQSETIKKVVLPAALPGIVGAILLAASRAIGETMIVVLGAGAAARMSLNPFEAMTTVTAKIVSQLTGDADFSSPEALVAFALGMTLFVITLGLNIIALYIVRKYREQYE